MVTLRGRGEGSAPSSRAAARSAVKSRGKIVVTDNLFLIHKEWTITSETVQSLRRWISRRWRRHLPDQSRVGHGVTTLALDSGGRRSTVIATELGSNSHLIRILERWIGDFGNDASHNLDVM